MKNIIKILLRVTFVLGYFITKTFKNKKNVKPDKNKNVKTFFFTLMYSVISSLRLRSILHRLPRSTDLPSDASQASSAGAHLCVDFMFYYCRQRYTTATASLSEYFLSCKYFPPQTFLFLLRDSLHGFPRLFTVYF